MLLRSTADFFGAVRASSPVVAGDVAPLQYALGARHTLRKFVNGAKYNIATCSGKIPVTKISSEKSEHYSHDFTQQPFGF